MKSKLLIQFNATLFIEKQITTTVALCCKVRYYSKIRKSKIRFVQLFTGKLFIETKRKIDVMH